MRHAAHAALVIVALAALAGVMATPAAAYTYPGNNRVQNDGRYEWPGGTFTWRFNQDTSDALPNIVDGSDPRAAVQASFAQWAAESGATNTQGSDTSVSEAGNDGVNVVTFVDTAANRTAVGGALAVCIFNFDNSNNLISSDIVFNPQFTFTTTGGPSTATPISSVITHEIGHWHGLAHSGVVGATMYPFTGSHGAAGNSELVGSSISPDDRSGINLSYPDPVFAAVTGRITGQVTKNATPVYGAHVVAENIVTGVAMAGNITLHQNLGDRYGRYEISGLPPGTYHVYAEPLDGPTSFSNWVNTIPNGWFNQTAAGATFDTAFLTTSAAAPVVVTVGGTAVANIAVTSGTPAVDIETTGSGTISCPRPPGTGFSLASGTPVAVPAGFTGALYMSGLGLEAGLGATVSISDPTITVDNTCRRETSSGATATLLLPMTVPAGTRPGPRTIWVTLPGGEKGACTGCLEIEGPANETGLCSNGIDDDGDGFIDGTDMDCPDDCPLDPLKTSPGQCGCGVLDTDTDGDGTADCVDGCPSDGTKTTPGACGCGIADTDSDGDGTANCVDGCPNDGTKTSPGTCGCGISDADSDGDGAKDCVEACDADPLKTAPGDCGCGVADTDGDGDSTADCIDNCPTTPNADQADVNGNGTGDACEGLSLRLDRPAGSYGVTNAAVRLFVDSAADGPCVSLVRVTVGFDGGSLALTAVEPVAGCSVSTTVLDPDSVRIQLTCSPGFDSPGTIATLRFQTPASGPGERFALTATAPEANDCTPVALAPAAFGGSLTVGGLLGNLETSGAGSSSVGLADFVLSRRKALRTIPTTDYDEVFGDLSPGQITCARPAGQASSWCVTGDATLGLADVVILRRRVSAIYTFDCAACAARLAARHAGQRIAGDIGPGEGDGLVTVADAVRALRVSVGLEEAAGESLLRGDVAPASLDGDGMTAVRGDGVVSVGDVVMLLRASVGLAEIAWPRREMVVVLEDEAPALAWHARVDGWPAWAEPSGLLAEGCDETAGLDADGPAWSALCALDAEEPGPRVTTWLYRAAEPVDASGLTASAVQVDEALTERPSPVRVFAP